MIWFEHQCFKVDRSFQVKSRSQRRRYGPPFAPSITLQNYPILRPLLLLGQDAGQVQYSSQQPLCYSPPSPAAPSHGLLAPVNPAPRASLGCGRSHKQFRLWHGEYKNITSFDQFRRLRTVNKGFFMYVLYSTLFHLPPLRFHCVGTWDRTQDS